MTLQVKLLVLSAMGAMAIASASAAQASQLHVDTQWSASLSGEQTVEHVLSTDILDTIRCKSVSLEGTALPTSQELTLTGGYGQCQHIFGTPSVRMNGCKYIITNKTVLEPTSSLTAYVDITGCTVGKRIEITMSGGFPCTVQVPEQHNLGHVIFENISGHVLAKITLSGISYVGQGQCPGLSPGVFTQNGQYTGQITVKARLFEGSQQVIKGLHQYMELVQTGMPINLTAT